MQIMSITRSTFPSSAPEWSEEIAATAWPQCRAVASGEGHAPESCHRVLAVNSAPMCRSAPGRATHQGVHQWWVQVA